MLEQQIIKYLYDNYPFAIFMTLLLSAMQSSVVLHDDNRQVIFYWFIGLIFVQSLRFADYFYFKRIHNSEIYSIYEMFRNFRIGIFLTGVLFGAFPVLLIGTATITDMVFIAFVLAGITAASISSLGVDRISLISFLTASLIPLLICFFSIGGYMPNIMATMIFFFMIYLMVIGNRFRKQLIANVELTNEALQSKKALASRQHISELIVKIQSAYLDNNISLQLFEEVLQEIIELSGVQYCFICQIEQQSDEELRCRVLANPGKLDLARLKGDALKIGELNLRPLSLEAWAGAWQSQFFTTYITHYHPDFEPDDFETRQAWRDDRRERIMEPEFIRIGLRDFNLLEQGFVEPGGEWVRVQFLLSYRRPDYADQSLKEIVLRERNGLWLITEERTLEVNIISD